MNLWGGKGKVVSSSSVDVADESFEECEDSAELPL